MGGCYFLWGPGAALHSEKTGPPRKEDMARARCTPTKRSVSVSLVAQNPRAGEKVKMKTQRDLSTVASPPFLRPTPPPSPWPLPSGSCPRGPQDVTPPTLATFIIPDLNPATDKCLLGSKNIQVIRAWKKKK